jgi:hypothetical protein
MISRSRIVAVAAVLALAACSGSEGAQGAQGAKGDQGVQGDPAPGGIVSSTPVTAPLNAVPIVPRANPSTPSCDGLLGMQFFGLTGEVLSLAANQRIVASAAFDIGGTGNASADNLTLGLCYQLVHPNQTEGSIIVDSDASVGDPFNAQPLSVGSSTRIPFSITRMLTAGPLTGGDIYRVGVCGCVDDTGDWAPGFGQMTIQVIQPINP